MSREDPICPYCGKPLVYRDTRSRIWKWYGGIKRHIRVRRLLCKSCERIHVELPDVLVPNKHYGSEVIENVADGVSTPDDLTTEDYPCVKTMERWQDWITLNTPQIDGFLKSIGTRFLEMHEALLSSTDSLLTALRHNGAGWLSLITGIIYRAGGSLLTASRDKAYAPALSVFPDSRDVSSSQKEDIHHENRHSNDLAGRYGPAEIPDDRSSSG